MPRGKKAEVHLPVVARASSRALVIPDDKAADAAAGKEAYNQMNDKLKKATAQVFSMLINIAQEGIKRMWKVGEFLRKIRDNEEAYGEDALYLVEKVLGKSSKSTIQKALILNSWVTEPELDKMLNRKMKITGKPLSWQHYEKLLTIKDQDQRDDALEQTVNRELTPEELQKLALHARGKTEAHAGGRPVAVPATYTAKSIHYLKKFNAITRDADAIYDNSEHGFFEQSEGMPADKITPEMIEKTQEMIEATRSVMDFCRQFVLRLEDTNAVLQKRMNAQAQKQGEAEAAAISPEPETEDAEVEDPEAVLFRG
jgi:hypothetical protein